MKSILSFLFLALSLQTSAQVTIGLPIYTDGTLAFTNFFRTNALYNPPNVRVGGFLSGASTLAQLQDTTWYPMNLRQAGQLAGLTDQSIYQLGSNLVTWTKREFGGSGITAITTLTNVSLLGSTFIENGQLQDATFQNAAHLLYTQMDSFKAGQTDNAASQLFVVQQSTLAVTNVATLLTTPSPARGRAAKVATGGLKGTWVFCPDEVTPDNGFTVRRPSDIATDLDRGRWVFVGADPYSQGVANGGGLAALTNLSYYPLNQRMAGEIVTLTNGTVLQLGADLTTWNTRTFGDSVTNITGNAGTATKLATARTIGMTGGDVAWSSPAFDGTANVSSSAILNTVNANVGTFGSSTLIPVITANAKGLVTAVNTVAVSGGGSYDPYVYKSATSVQILNSAAETSLFPAAVTIPANTLVADGENLTVNIPFKWVNNSGANRGITFKVKVGGVTVFDESTATSLSTGTAARVGAFRVNVLRRGGTVASGSVELTLSSVTATTAGLGDFAVVATVGIGGFEGATWDFAAGVTLDVTATFSNALATIQLDTYGATIRK